MITRLKEGVSVEKITSFTIDHLRLLPGLYVSRKDAVGKEMITTFDLRLCQPNAEPVLNTAEIHTIEHLAATYLRNNPCWSDGDNSYRIYDFLFQRSVGDVL